MVTPHDYNRWGRRSFKARIIMAIVLCAVIFGVLILRLTLNS